MLRNVADEPSQAERIKVAKFPSENAEAHWWDEHREMVEDNLIRALEDGTVERGVAGRLVREARGSRVKQERREAR